MSQKFSWIVRSVGALVAVGAVLAAGVAYATVPTLSQTSVTVGIGQSASVTSENGTSVYMEANSNSTVASISVNGTQLTVTGVAPGSTNLTICGVGTASDCTNLGVTVQVGSVAGISFSQSNLSLSIGSNQSVTISGGNGNYIVSSNSNTSVASTNLSGNTLTVSGLAAGGATINVCDTSNTCGTLSVTIGSSGTASLSFSVSSFSLAASGNQIITISGGNGTYNVSSNSNTNVATTNLSNNQVTVYAVSAGSATIRICDTSGICGTLYVTVTASTASQAVTFSVTNPTLTVGQTLSVQLSGGTSGYVVLSNANANVIQATMNGASTLSLYGASAGTDIVTICATNGGCSPLSATVTGTGSTTPPVTTTPPPTTTTTQSGSVVANATLLAEIQTIQTAITQALTQIEAVQTELNQLQAQVNAGSGSSLTTNAGTSSGTSYDFTELLTVGSQDAQVTALQQRLIALGFYSGPVTGYYGALTEQAVIKYQAAHGIAATGYVGPGTRVALNAGN